MSLHETIEEVDNWVWELVFRSDQRVISTPIRLWSLIRLAADYVLECGCGRVDVWGADVRCGRVAGVAS